MGKVVFKNVHFRGSKLSAYYSKTMGGTVAPSECVVELSLSGWMPQTLSKLRYG